jgi:hypothetical protein
VTDVPGSPPYDPDYKLITDLEKGLPVSQRESRKEFRLSGRPDLFDKNQREGIDKLFPLFFGLCVMFCVVFYLALVSLIGWATIRLILHFT